MPVNILVLQGGGALGAYQAGVFEVLAPSHPIDWVVGTSIGAINAAIIAGNQPGKRLEKLQEFWQGVSASNPLQSFSSSWMPPWLYGNTRFETFETLAFGVPGFFTPRPAAQWNINETVSVGKASFYDTAPLKKTLERLIDFDYLNSGAVRCAVSAVAVATSSPKTFDSKFMRLTAEHIMASGALPPGFAPVVIDGAAYWDGGIYSNSPIDIVLDDPATSGESVCFMVDLWDPTEDEPTSIAGAMTRLKDIQYASRSREHLAHHKKNS